MVFLFFSFRISFYSYTYLVYFLDLIHQKNVFITFSLLLFIIEFLLIQVFNSFRFNYFFIFFLKALLIPMFLLIGYWGGRESDVSMLQSHFLFITLIGSLFMLCGIIYL